jgi:hypothetical protein
MQILEIPYATWSSLVDNNALAVFAMRLADDQRSAFAGSRATGIVWRTAVGPEAYAEYASKYAAYEVEVGSSEDAIAHIIGFELGSLPTIQEVRPNLYPEGVTLTFPGRADHATDGRMLGPRLQLSRSTDGDEVLEFGFNDQIVLSGGSIKYTGAVLGDWVRFDVQMPASPTPPTSGGTLNCVRVEIIPSSGLYMLVPAPAQYATHFLDLTDGTKWVPVPAQKTLVGTQRRAPDGFWEWNYPATGKGVLTPMPAQNGWWNIFEFAPPAVRFVPDANLLGDGHSNLGTSESLRPQTMLPHWVFKVTLHNEGGGHNLQFIVEKLHVGRFKPQPGNG